MKNILKRRASLLLLSLIVSNLLCGCGSRLKPKVLYTPHEETVSATSKPTTEEPSSEYLGYTSQGTPIVDSDNYDDVRMIPTPDSTCFSYVGYKSGRLVVTFRDSGASYAYLDVPEGVWEELRDAYSMGGYYNSAIKGYYDCEKLD